jgi:hypothetical protein
VTRTVLLLLATCSMALSASAQTTDPIARALLAAPPSLRDGATVIKWQADFSYETLRKGTNNLVCYDRSGAPLQRPFAIECTMQGNLPRVAQSMRFEAVGDRAKANVLIEAAEKDGTRIKPEFGSVFYNAYGPDEQHRMWHSTIAVPGATRATLGLPETASGGGVWIMSAGTSTAHLMIPGQ